MSGRLAAPPLTATKGEWREWARAVRAPIDWDATSSLICAELLAWRPLRTAATVLVYLPLPDEVRLQPLLDSALPCRWLATRTPFTGMSLTIHELGGPLEEHPYGYLQPGASAPEVLPGDVDAVLVPGLSFDRAGGRLGRGAGYYDRLLAKCREGALLVGVVPGELVVGQLPTTDRDVPMTHLATEEGVIEIAAAS